MRTHYHLNREYEIIPEFSPRAQAKHIQLAWVERFYKALVHYLIDRGEPRIWQESDSTGKTWWRAYDPTSQQSLVCASEDEVRLWLEQLPYA